MAKKASTGNCLGSESLECTSPTKSKWETQSSRRSCLAYVVGVLAESVRPAERALPGVKDEEVRRDRPRQLQPGDGRDEAPADVSRAENGLANDDGEIGPGTASSSISMISGPKPSRSRWSRIRKLVEARARARDWRSSSAAATRLETLLQDVLQEH